MRRHGFWIGLGLGVVLVGAFAVTSESPVRAAAPQGAVAAQAAAQVRAAGPMARAAAHRFAPAPARPAAARAHQPSRGAKFLSMVAGDAAVGAPPVAAVREEGRVRLVQAGDRLDGAIVAGIAANGLTLRAGANTMVLPRSR